MELNKKLVAEISANKFESWHMLLFGGNIPPINILNTIKNIKK
jgi:hypothetical protein